MIKKLRDKLLARASKEDDLHLDILRLLSEKRYNGRDLRQELNRLGYQLGIPEFYNQVSKLESTNLIDKNQAEVVIGNLKLKQTIYKLTDSGFKKINCNSITKSGNEEQKNP